MAPWKRSLSKKELHCICGSSTETACVLPGNKDLQAAPALSIFYATMVFMAKNHF